MSLLSNAFKFSITHIIAIQMPLTGTIKDLSSYICFAPLGLFVLKYKMAIKHVISYDENIVRRASSFAPVSESWVPEIWVNLLISSFFIPFFTLCSPSCVEISVLLENIPLCN